MMITLPADSKNEQAEKIVRTHKITVTVHNICIHTASLDTDVLFISDIL